MTTNRSVVLRRRPSGSPLAEDFAVSNLPLPALRPAGLVVKVLECSLDPAMRRWMDVDSYANSIPLEAPLPCTLIGRVTESDDRGYAPGDLVTGKGTVSEFASIQIDGFTRLIDAAGLPSLSCHLSVLGTSGLTAYNGLLKVGRPKTGETVLVSAAAGSVGSLVGQIATLHGCRAVGIAGGERKCRRLVEQYGFDAAIDRTGKSVASLARDIAVACPRGVDVYFDNVGGVCLDAALLAINHKARIVLCGMISEYNSIGPAHGITHLWQVVAKTATMSGFLNREYLSNCSTELRQLRDWIAQERITWTEHVEAGIENFYPAFMRLFAGTNEGKVILRIASAD